MEQIEIGNLYINRGTTGAIVNRQPFGGWRRSSVGPTAKAGGQHYVNSLRRWAPLTDAASSIEQALEWWRSTGSQAIDRSGLAVEKNFQRYRRHAKPIVVRVDAAFDETGRSLINAIVHEAGVVVSYSALEAVAAAPDAVIRSTTSLGARAEGVDQVRWLSRVRAERGAPAPRGQRRPARARPTRRRRDGAVATRAERRHHPSSLRQRERRTEAELRGIGILSVRGLGPRCDGVGPLATIAGCSLVFMALSQRVDARGGEVDPVIGHPVGHYEDVAVRHRTAGVDDVRHVAVLLVG